jgi:hypothetical protein
MYPSVMSPLPDPPPESRPHWPRETNGLTRAVAEQILVSRGLLPPPPPD